MKLTPKIKEHHRGNENCKKKECDNPFEEAGSLSDVALVVENKKLFVNKTLLALHSPVFLRMFFSEFSEKHSEEVELPGKSHYDVLNFLIQLYPVYSLRKITDDSLPGVLALAEEYMVEHLRQKCKHYIRDRSRCTLELTIDQLLLYLSLADRCRFTSLRRRLTREAERRTPQGISQSQFYEDVDARLMRDIFYAKNLQNEQAFASWRIYAERGEAEEEEDVPKRTANREPEQHSIVNHIWWSFL